MGEQKLEWTRESKTLTVRYPFVAAYSSQWPILTMTGRWRAQVRLLSFLDYSGRRVVSFSHVCWTSARRLSWDVKRADLISPGSWMVRSCRGGRGRDTFAVLPQSQGHQL